MTAAPLLNNCATTIHDFTSCAEYPGGNIGARCTDFLTHTNVSLDNTAWQNMKAQWNKDGDAVECTRSSSLAQIKGEIEKMCGQVTCDQRAQQMVEEGLDRMGELATSVLKNPTNIEFPNVSEVNSRADIKSVSRSDLGYPNAGKKSDVSGLTK